MYGFGRQRFCRADYRTTLFHALFFVWFEKQDLAIRFKLQERNGTKHGKKNENHGW